MSVGPLIPLWGKLAQNESQQLSAPTPRHGWHFMAKLARQARLITLAASACVCMCVGRPRSLCARTPRVAPNLLISRPTEAVSFLNPVPCSAILTKDVQAGPEGKCRGWFWVSPECWCITHLQVFWGTGRLIMNPYWLEKKKKKKKKTSEISVQLHWSQLRGSQKHANAQSDSLQLYLLLNFQLNTKGSSVAPTTTRDGGSCVAGCGTLWGPWMPIQSHRRTKTRPTPHTRESKRFSRGHL